MILDKFIEIHSELQYCILTMDVGSQEDRTKFSKLYFQLYSLFLISDKLENYCNNLFELQEMLTDPFCDNDAIEEKIEVILSSIDEQYVDVVDRLVEGEKNNMNGNIEGYSIMQCYKLLYDFCASMKLSEESYCDLLHNLYAFEIAINADLFGKIIEFCENVIEPEIDRNLEINFTIEEAEEIDGVINLKSEEAEKKLLSAYMEQLFDLENKIRDFGEEVLKPYLVA